MSTNLLETNLQYHFFLKKGSPDTIDIYGELVIYAMEIEKHTKVGQLSIQGQFCTKHKANQITGCLSQLLHFHAKYIQKVVPEDCMFVSEL
jgi:hypothetical protein